MRSKNGFSVIFLIIVVFMFVIVGMVAAVIIPRTKLAGEIMQKKTYSTWKKYSYPLQKFAIDFPSEPKIKNTPVFISSDLSLDLYTYESSPNDYTDFLAITFALPEEIISKLSSKDKLSLLDKLTQNIVANVEGLTITSKQQSTFQGFSSVVFDGLDTKGYLVVRGLSFMPKNKIVILLYTNNGKSINETNYQQFIQSYQEL